MRCTFSDYHWCGDNPTSATLLFGSCINDPPRPSNSGLFYSHCDADRTVVPGGPTEGSPSITWDYHYVPTVDGVRCYAAGCEFVDTFLCGIYADDLLPYEWVGDIYVGSRLTKKSNYHAYQPDLGMTDCMNGGQSLSDLPHWCGLFFDLGPALRPSEIDYGSLSIIELQLSLFRF